MTNDELAAALDRTAAQIDDPSDAVVVVGTDTLRLAAARLRAADAMGAAVERAVRLGALRPRLCTTCAQCDAGDELRTVHAAWKGEGR